MLCCVRTHQTYEFVRDRCSTYQTRMIKFFCTLWLIFLFGCLLLLEKTFSSWAYQSFIFLISKTWFQSFPKEKCVVFFLNKLFYRREFLSSMSIVTHCHICYRHTYFAPNLVDVRSFLGKAELVESQSYQNKIKIRLQNFNPIFRSVKYLRVEWLLGNTYLLYFLFSLSKYNPKMTHILVTWQSYTTCFSIFHHSQNNYLKCSNLCMC